MDIEDIILLVLVGPIVLAGLLSAFAGAVIFVGYILLAIGRGIISLCEEIKWLLYEGVLIITGQRWKSKKWEWALAAVKRMTRQDHLKKVAVKSPDPKVRLAALKKIKDLEYLKKIASRDADTGIRKWFCWIFDEERLIDIVLNESSWDVFKTAVEQLLKGSLDDTLLNVLTSSLAKHLKTDDLPQKRACAEYLQTIYKQYISRRIIRDGIRSHIGTIIYEGHEHMDTHTDYIDTRGSSVEVCMDTHVDEHTDHPAQPAEYFNVEESIKL
ncbi:MAG: hypothetical protein LBQ39_10495 [Tannerellaceae bacterium]|jgi:hypothetical protein|nr:hypothetical protein [Tannerellaceae bacterium]